MLIIFTTALTALSIVVQGHMMLNYPPAFNSSNNPHKTGPADPFLYYPTNCCGRNYAGTGPCHGYLSLLGTPEGAPVASWAAGSKQQFSLTGAGNHYGGSCQVGFSTDNGKTFKVATSYEGNCPHRNGGVTPSDQTFDFTVPNDIPTGDAVFAWTFNNREQEFFMNCAAVSITPAGNAISTASVAAPVTYAAAVSVQNAAPSYDMDGCVCTCPSAVEGNADNTYTTGPCHCSCDSMPPTSVTGGYSKRDVEKRQQAPTYDMGDCACTCAKQAKKYLSGKYETAGCLCTCKSEPSQNTSGAVGRRSTGLSRIVSHWMRQVATTAKVGANTQPHGALDNLNDPQVKRTTTVWADRPSMLFADVQGDCKSPLTYAELKYPDPGPNVVTGDGIYPLQLPSGSCA